MAGYSYLFGGSTGETPETLKRKRELAMAIMGAQSAPRNVGEGLTALGAGITAGIMNRRADKAESAGRAEAGARSNDLRSQLAARIAGTPLPPANRSGPGSVTSTTPVVGTPSGGPSSYRDAIASIESKGSGDYAAVGPTNPKMGRALGRYQVMEANVGPWSKEALGREVSADEFLANPQIQDAIFDHKFGGYVNKFGQEGAAQAWFAGPGGVGKTDRKDVLGTDVGSYGRKFMTALGPQPQEVASADPQAAFSAVMPQQGSQPVAPLPNSLPAEFQRSQQLANASGGIMHALNGGTPASGDQGAQARAMETGGTGTPQPQPEQDQGPSEELLYGILTHPFSSPEQKAVAQTLLQQRMQRQQAAEEQQARQNDPLYRLKVQQAEKELAGGDRQPLINAGGGSIYDPNEKTWITPPEASGAAGGFRFSGDSVEAQSLNGLMDSGKLTPEQAQQLGAGKTITGPNGEIIFLTPQGVFGTSSQGGGDVRPITPNAGQGAPQGGAQAVPQAPEQAAPPVTGGGNIQVTAPKVTVDEKHSAGFADRMVGSGKLIDKFGAYAPSLWDQTLNNNPYVWDPIENTLVSKDFQQLDQARRDFINAQLRRESGAVISQEEFDNANRQYLPQFGDTKETIGQKARNRQVVIDGMVRSAGPTYSAPEGDSDPLGIR